MAELLEFPSRRARGLAFLDRELRALLRDRGADEALVDFAAGELTRLYSQLTDSPQFSFQVELPPGLAPEDRQRLERQIEAGLEGVRTENHRLMVNLVARLVLAQMRLFQHERRD